MAPIIDKTMPKFIIVGIINTLVGMAIMFGLYNLGGCSYWVSSATNYILVSFLSFGLNKKFTFEYKGNTMESGLRFALTIAGCYLLAYGIAKPWVMAVLEGQTKSIQENSALLIGMVLFTGFNYVGQRWFVFAGPKIDPESEDGKMLEEMSKGPKGK